MKTRLKFHKSGALPERPVENPERALERAFPVARKGRGSGKHLKNEKNYYIIKRVVGLWGKLCPLI